MCIRDRGYDAKVANYVGNDWAINVAADAVNAGIAPKGDVYKRQG